MKTYFHEFLIERVGSFSRYLSCHTTISMSIVLFEMMVSLGWNIPELTVTSRAHNRVYVCEVVLQSKEGSLVGVTGRTMVKGGEEITEAEAIESGAEAAVLYLEKNLSIFLVNINYNKRSKANLRVAETLHVKQLFSTIVSEVKAEWKSQVDKLGKCDDHFQEILSEHAIKDPYNGEYNIKWECAEMVATLYEACQRSMRHACCLHLAEAPPKRKQPIFKKHPSLALASNSFQADLAGLFVGDLYH